MKVNDGFALQRRALVEQMKQGGVVESGGVEKAFLRVKRELFFPPEMRAHAYVDSAFPIGFGQTISQPSTIAIMLELLDVKPSARVLEVGSGSGYVVALLCELAFRGRVFGVEIVRALKERALKSLRGMGEKNFELVVGDGTVGWPEKAPFDRVLVSAACSDIPLPLLEQLVDGGKLVAPVGNRFMQELVCVEKLGGQVKEIARKCCFVFVPLRGAYASPSTV